MNSRERVDLVISHREPDRIPLDLGGSYVTGMHASTVYALRQALKLDTPGIPVKVIEPFQMLGEIAPDLVDALGVDVVSLCSETTMFGYRKESWKTWTLFDGTPVLVPGGFNTQPDIDGSILMYPEGDDSAPPSAKMPRDGFYFDAVDKQKPIEWEKLNVEDNLEEYGPISNVELEYLRREANRLYYETDKAILASFGGTSFGDLALVPGHHIRKPKGIRGYKEWYMCHVKRPDYILKIFSKQCEIALENLEKIQSAIGDRITVAFISGTDFGMQDRPVMSKSSYEKYYKPFHEQVNKWVHENTSWKTFIHTCGSIEPLIRDFIDSGFDILNPVQTSAADMQPRKLQSKYGGEIAFWGGGVDTQRTLPFGTPEQVEREVKKRIKVFGPGGGFIFNTIHNVQPRIPIDNIITMYRTIREFGEYPIG